MWRRRTMSDTRVQICQEAMGAIVRLVLCVDDDVCAERKIFGLRGGTTLTSQTSKSCAGQCFLPSPTTDQGVALHHQKSPRRKDALRGQSQRTSRSPEQSREAPREPLETQDRQLRRLRQRDPSTGTPENTEPARQVKIEPGAETRQAGRACRRARGEKSPSGDWSGLPGYMGPARPRAKSIGRNGPRTLPREGRGQSIGRNGPRIRPRDDGISGHRLASKRSKAVTRMHSGALSSGTGR